MAFNIIITDAGRAELINANHTGTAPVAITHVALSAQPFTPTKGLSALPHESRRLSSIAGETVAPDTISVTVKDESSHAYTVHGFGLITEHGTLLAVYSQAEPIIEKSGPTTLLLTTDIVLADIDAAHLSFGDISFSNPPASLTTPGVVTLSNSTESNAQNQAATPRAVKAANDNANTRLAKSQNLSDIPSPGQARSNLGLGASATMSTTASRTSTSTTTVLQAKAMNDHRQSGDHDGRYVQRSQNLSDLTNAATARNNLGLGAAATRGVGENTHDVMAVGAFGLGDRAVNPGNRFSNDFNFSDIPSGFYTIAGEWVNGPLGNAIHTGMLFHLKRSFNNQDIQWFFRNGSAAHIYYRSGNANTGAWGDWQELYHNGNLSPVETERVITTGDGLTGGGNLSSNRTISVDGTVIRTTGSQSISGEKRFTGGVNISNAGFNQHLSLRRGDLGTNVTITTAGNGRLQFNPIGGVEGVEFANMSVAADSFSGNLNASDLSSGLVSMARLPVGSSRGELMEVGAFGLGEPWMQPDYPRSNINADPSLIPSGIYRVTSGVSNTPLNATGVVLVAQYNSDTTEMMFFARGSSPRLYTRWYNNGWGDWVEQYNTGNLNPVETSRQINAGNGLTGGGNLTANRTISLDGATITSLGKADSAVQPDRSITAGNGLAGGGNLAGNRTISMGTPGTIGHDTNNNASGSTHTHTVKQAAFGNTRDGVNDGGFVTPETLHGAFLGPSASHSARGYQRLPGGLLFQWSFTNAIAAGQSQTLNFPITYPSEVFCIGLAVYRTANAAHENNSCSFAFNGRSSVIVRNNADTNKTIYVTALGI
ncbi:tail fiber protein [Vreelandella olivaria]|uniref:tail fiber protein n=1 Tax=Vreelandella olivaria TaxID=390919 RepID=UPI00201FB1E0|nr:tail fiber protein [Halomonas olivaria]